MLPFIPRKVARSLHKKDATPGSGTPAGTGSQQTLPARVHTPQSELAGHAAGAARAQMDVSNVKGKGKAQEDTRWLSEEDYVSLVRLSVSDYALWSDTDLRKTIEFADDGYVPLAYLVDRLPWSDGMDTRPPEAMLVKAIRTHASDTFEVRMMMASPSRAIWHGKEGAAQSSSAGGFEVRLKDWEEVLRRAGDRTRGTWDTLTVYVENIPPQYRNVAGIHRFLSTLLPTREEPNIIHRIEHISLPRHHLDKPGNLPKCKGFALVTLASSEDVAHLLQQWPWKSQRAQPDHPDDKSSEDASRFGFRAISKADWDKLNAEYLAYRQKLLDDLAQEDAAHLQSAPRGPSSSNLQDVPDRVTPDRESTPRAPALDLSAPFPPGCLVFIRNVHPETNKTTLRKLLSQAFASGEPASAQDGIDYVDFSKGMDTCHIRLAAPHHTQQLARHFAEHPTVQTQGLDGVGSAESAGKKPFVVEIITGEREALYWGKVPEKVRRQAVEKAVLGDRGGDKTGDKRTDASIENGGSKRKRKRKT